MIRLCVFLSLIGQQMVSDNDCIFEIGLLNIIRKIIMLSSDVMERSIIGYVIHLEALIAMADNKGIVLRTAVVRVSEVFMAMSISTCIVAGYIFQT